MNPLFFFSFIIVIIVITTVYNNHLSKKIHLTGRAMDNLILYNWLVSKKELSKLVSYQFEDWCRHYLKMLGYADFVMTRERSDGGKDMVCSIDDTPVYVRCVQIDKDTELDKDELYPKVGRPEAQMFVGNMKHDGIYKGLIITPGYFSDYAIVYVKNLPPEYDIRLINGDELSMSNFKLVRSAVNV